MLVPDLLRNQARSSLGDKPAVVIDRGEGPVVSPQDMQPAMTFADWDRRSDRLAAALVEAGMKPGDRVAIGFENRDADRFYVSYFATLKAGGVAVPIGVRLVEAEVGHILRHAEPTAAVADAARSASLRKIGYGGRVLGPEDYDRAVARDVAAPQVARAEDDLCDILYTSGTTGAPKGVACTHRSVCAVGRMPVGPFEGRAFLHAIPVFTFAGTQAMQLAPMCTGMHAVVMHKFDAQRYLALMAAHRAAASFAVPSMLRLALDAWDAMPPAERPDTTPLKLLLFGTAPMPPSTLARLPELLPKAFLINVYGLTEIGGAACVLPPNEVAKRPTSVGRPIPPTEVRIVVADEATGAQRDGKPGEVGEVWMKTGQRGRTYYQNAEASAQTYLEGGWIRTGDLGHFDADGYLYLDDRAKDMVIRGGFNIFPAELDALLQAHPAVKEAAVVGVPHPVLGEDLRAFVALWPGKEASGDELRAYLGERIADYKVPRTYVFLEALPRNALGKVVKRQLKEMAAT